MSAIVSLDHTFIKKSFKVPSSSSHSMRMVSTQALAPDGDADRTLLLAGSAVQGSVLHPSAVSLRCMYLKARLRRVCPNHLSYLTPWCCQCHPNPRIVLILWTFLSG